MSKRYLSSILGLIVLGGMYYFLKKTSVPKVGPHKNSTPPSLRDTISSKKDGKKIVGLGPERVKDQLKKLVVHNYVSEEWEPNLRKTLLAQGSDAIESINIQKEDSFVMVRDGLSLYVESVVVTLKNKSNVKVTFRALVDAQTGKILETWDRPLFDPSNPKDNFSIRVDPLHNNE